MQLDGSVVGGVEDAVGRFAGATDEIRRSANEIREELDSTRSELKRGAFDLPEEAKESAAAMRRAVAEQIKALQKELSGSDDEEDEVEAFREKLEALDLPEIVMKEAQRELNRLARMHPDSAEASVIRTYLTTIVELPWNKRTEDRLDLAEAARILDEDHYGLEKVKDRVLEYLAVRKLKAERAQKGELDEAGNELAMAYDVIVSHGGRVEVDVTPGKLTRTMIRLPIR